MCSSGIKEQISALKSALLKANSRSSPRQYHSKIGRYMQGKFIRAVKGYSRRLLEGSDRNFGCPASLLKRKNCGGRDITTLCFGRAVAE